MHRGMARFRTGKQDGNGIVPARPEPEPEGNVIAGKAFPWLHQSHFKTREVPMGLVHGSNKHSTQKERAQINQAVLIIDAG